MLNKSRVDKICLCFLLVQVWLIVSSFCLGILKNKYDKCVPIDSGFGKDESTEILK